jgi:hypothetical protein
MRKLLLGLVFISCALAQDYAALRQVLGLSDAQVARLKEMQVARRVHDSEINRKAWEKQQQLEVLLQGDSPDALTVGLLEMEIWKLRQQTATPARIRGELEAVLNKTQRETLIEMEKVDLDAVQLGILPMNCGDTGN